MSFKNFIAQAFSENGRPSSKRILAGIMILVIMFCTVWSVINIGITDNNLSIMEYEIVIAGALLGVTSITSIWKPGVNQNPSNKLELSDDDYDCYNEEYDNKHNHHEDKVNARHDKNK